MTEKIRHHLLVSAVLIVGLLNLQPAISEAALEDRLDPVASERAPWFGNVQWFNSAVSGDDSFHDKVVLVNFWATWCPPCIEELPSMQMARASYDQTDFEVVAVNVGETRAEVQNFISAMKLSLRFPIVIDEKLKVYGNWEVRGLPTSFLVDRNGMIRFKAVGGRNFNSENIRSIIQGLINE